MEMNKMNATYHYFLSSPILGGFAKKSRIPPGGRRARSLCRTSARRGIFWRVGAAFGLWTALSLPKAALAQSQPLPGKSVQDTYQQLLPSINDIKIFDDHAHPGFSDDPNVDAMASPPGSSPFRVRETNPEYVMAAKALFGYPYSDFSPAHEGWLLRRTANRAGTAYWDRILDRCGIAVSLANRAAMAGYLDPKRFRWVFFVDSFLFPFDNANFTNRNPDERVYIPLQEKMLRRYMRQAGVRTLPDSLGGYLEFIDEVVQENQARGGLAMKFEIAYFRSLRFSDPPRSAAAVVYHKYCRGGLPSTAEYKTFQDFVFRYLIRLAARVRLPVNIHTAAVGGDYFHMGESNVMNLENILRDPRYVNTTFVLLHGGYPYDRNAIWLTAMKNVYIDSSEIELLLYPAEFTRILKRWFEIYPEKVMFGSDAYPYSNVMGAEETYWLGARTARRSLAAALAKMICEDEVTEAQALEIAHEYLHDTAARLYGGG
jgi:hypothetical protein